MQKILIIILCLLLCATIAGCNNERSAQIAATTLPVYEFTSILCDGTGITVNQLIDTQISCLHDYTLDVRQMQIIESADLVVISGAGLEDFMGSAITDNQTLIDASFGIALLCEDVHDHDVTHHTHSHDSDPHIWLSPRNAQQMAANIYQGLLAAYPQHKDLFQQNLNVLNGKIAAVQNYANDELSSLTNRDLITFHDGFAYLAQAFDLTIQHAIEEESGSEASAAELIELIQTVSDHNVPAIFTEKNGSTSAAAVIAAETGVAVFSLDMAISGDSYFTAMYQNIDTLKEALK